MVYVSQGQILDRRSPWRLSIISDTFWAVVEFVQLFFRTLVQPDLTKHGRSNARSGYGNGRGPPPYPGRRFGGFGPNSSSPPAPPMGGG